jgi:uncharacterized protein YqfA (UPF0365 family)
METQSKKPPRVVARELVVRHLQLPAGRAQDKVAELDDAEVAELLGAGRDKETARQEINSIFARASDRRRDAAAAEARQRMKTQRRSALARKVLERELGMSIDESMLAVGKLTERQLDELAALESMRGCAEECWAVLGLVPAEPESV